jgi:nucleoside-diphosphate-sugar epimerase
MRVLIVGGLGYIGSGLIEKYKATDADDIKVDIIDKRFVPHILTGLPENFHFVHGDMRDDSAIDPLLEKEPDRVYLLAAEVQAESSVNRERIIWENNFEAIVKVTEKCPPKSKLIFSSTGNVFGGVDESEKYMNLTEEDEPKPKYPYAESKRAVEKHLLAGDKDFVICRFGTNYGYAPGIRFNLVTNNFIKKALAGEPITIHGKGENFRPTVCVKLYA